MRLIQTRPGMYAIRPANDGVAVITGAPSGKQLFSGPIPKVIFPLDVPAGDTPILTAYTEARASGIPPTHETPVSATLNTGAPAPPAPAK